VTRAAAPVPEVVEITLEPISAPRFEPYGQVLEPGALAFPHTDEGRIGVELIDLAASRFDPANLQSVALHFSYNQLFCVLSGRLALVVAPAPGAPDGDPARCPLDYDGLRVFALGPGDVVLIDAGTWHQTVALGGPVRFLNVTRKDPDEQSSPLVAERRYIEHVDIGARDGRLLRIIEA
jgi:mannose-6-phosphate isomerase-like protein (cupin superfamily)